MVKCTALFPKGIEINASVDDSDPESFALARLSTRFRKKFRAGASADSDEVAIRTFLDCNQVCKNVDITLDREIIGNSREFITHALERFTRLHVSNAVQESLSMQLLLSLWRFGPGASNGVPGSHFCHKIDKKWTYTKRVEPFIKLLRNLTPLLASYDRKRNGFIGTEVIGSRTQAVPKNEQTSRLICIEPLGNMALQLAAGTYIEGSLRRYGINISNADPIGKPIEQKRKDLNYLYDKDLLPKKRKNVQSELNCELARLGSVDGTLSTIDLKSASDLITPLLIKTLWPREWYELFMLLRSPVTTIKGHGDIELNMMSTMGNGFTFPMMTMTLASLCYAVERSNNKESQRFRWDSSKWGVFGDDIICPTERFNEVVSCLESCGLVVNNDKSFSTGFFRESCGGDFYKGVDVTPIYIKSLDQPHEVYVAINQLLNWSVKHRNYALWQPLIELVKMLPHSPYLVPEWEDPASGILCRDVPRHYKYLSPAKDFKVLRLTDPDLELLCVLGGYVSSSGDRKSVV